MHFSSSPARRRPASFVDVIASSEFTFDKGNRAKSPVGEFVGVVISWLIPYSQQRYSRLWS
jgi:hypothetical protein